MKIFKKLNLNIITIILVILVTFSACAIIFKSFINPGNKNETSTNAEAADLVISDYNGLVAFANSVNSGNTYSGKTVVLSNSIFCSDNAFSGIGGGSITDTSVDTYRFDGTFDGQGYTIYRFKINGYLVRQSRKIIGQKRYMFYYDHYAALFINIGSNAQIKNLKISDFEFSITKQSNVLGVTGHQRTYNYYFAGLVSNYHDGGTVDQCYINSGSEANYYGNITVSNTLTLGNNYASNLSGTNLSGSTSQNPPQQLNSLSLSSVGGEGVSIWYYAPEYNDGWPLPRVFIKIWETIKFEARLYNIKTSLSEIIPTIKVVVPNNMSSSLDFSSTNNTIDVLNQIVTANDATSIGYRFKRFVKFAKLKYYVDYEPIPCTITFNTATNTTVSASQTSVTVRYGATIEYEREGNVVTYTITDVNNGGTVYTITYTFSGETNNDYYVAEGNFGVSDNYEVTSDLIITPIATLKEYGSVWQ